MRNDALSVVREEVRPPQADAPQQISAPRDEHGALYWFWHKIGGRIKAFARRHWFLFTLLAVVSVVLFLMLRAVVHPYFIAVRTRIFLVVLGVPFAWFLWRKIFRGSIVRRVIWAGISVPLVASLIVWGDNVHDYLGLYWRYVTVAKRELQELPTTDHERIQPLNSIYSLAHEAMGENDKPQTPDFVRIGKEFRWTAGVEPTYVIPRFLTGVREVINISGTAPAPDFTRDRPVNVNFPTGENLMLGRNSFIATIRNFGIWRYLNYEPADVDYMTDDEGKWVQVVALIRWKGILFPRAEFGGVQVIRQAEETLWNDLKLVTIGVGEWIPPDQILQHPYLVGQNILSYRVSRYMADSFRYHKGGFFGAMPWWHDGDIRAPHLEEDVNPPPFTVYFNVPGRPGALYHYFGLEPMDVDKQGLSMSLLIPADGSGPVYFYDHTAHGEFLFGVSAASPKIREARKYYDWDHNKPVEHRPLVKRVDGKIRFFWLTSIVTMKQQVEGDQHFIAGATPELVITDAAHNKPVWVDASHQETWIDEARKQLGFIWASEGNMKVP